MPNRRPARGFTLVELLTVIGIIALLTAILFPVFARVRENARRTACQNNLRNVGMAMAQYIQDYDDGMLSGGYYNAEPSPTGWGVGWWYWYDLIQPYVKNTQILRCPSGVQYYADPPVMGHYGVNGDVIQNILWGPPLKATKLVAPSVTYMVFDAGQYEPHSMYCVNPGGPNGTMYIPGSEDAGMPQVDPTGPNQIWGALMNDYKHGRHFGGANVLFCDGHVKWLSTATILLEATKQAPTLHGAWNPLNG